LHCAEIVPLAILAGNTNGVHEVFDETKMFIQCRKSAMFEYWPEIETFLRRKPRYLEGKLLASLSLDLKIDPKQFTSVDVN
jgi:hypothetical protein